MGGAARRRTGEPTPALLGLHHVKPGPSQLAWDLGFLALGALQWLGGWALARAGHTETRARGGRPLRPAHAGR